MELPKLTSKLSLSAHLLLFLFLSTPFLRQANALAVVPVAQIVAAVPHLFQGAAPAESS